ncbi:MAG TPA: hypothetical protein PLN96_03870 [Zoogloea sp.]|nr:hypothetical protein [Zoogloea sp.]HMV18337.1 hypothetical protein [Rhodocyclaceae bacterium]HMV63620.1 hypothetical protein [Rhodocyclaceae bacterium]HMW52314.1 hypothetical protein [Rhodocyclaceae bacterium]HMY48808.1 hypothetical protein [Rhodocyclaceae bacterium]HMZ75208.1 hypothetical protein [Rhodocyclaceae bacterium]
MTCIRLSFRRPAGFARISRHAPALRPDVRVPVPPSPPPSSPC